MRILLKPIVYCFIFSWLAAQVFAQSVPQLSTALVQGLHAIASQKNICPPAVAVSAFALTASAGGAEDRCSPKLDPIVETSLLKTAKVAPEIESAKLVVGPQIFLFLYFRHKSHVSVDALKTAIEAGVRANGSGENGIPSAHSYPVEWKTGTFGGQAKVTILRLAEKLEVWIFLNEDGKTSDEIFFADDTNFPLID